MSDKRDAFLLRSCEHLLRAVLTSDGRMTRAWKRTARDVLHQINTNTPSLSMLLDDTPHYHGHALDGTLYQIKPSIRPGTSSPEGYRFGAIAVTEEMTECVGPLRFNRVQGLMLGDWQVHPEWVEVMT